MLAQVSDTNISPLPLFASIAGAFLFLASASPLLVALFPWLVVSAHTTAQPFYFVFTAGTNTFNTYTFGMSNVAQCIQNQNIRIQLENLSIWLSEQSTTLFTSLEVCKANCSLISVSLEACKANATSLAGQIEPVSHVMPKWLFAIFFIGGFSVLMAVVKVVVMKFVVSHVLVFSKTLMATLEYLNIIDSSHRFAQRSLISFPRKLGLLSCAKWSICVVWFITAKGIDFLCCDTAQEIYIWILRLWFSNLNGAGGGTGSGAMTPNIIS